jgi:hypothetical protein
MTLRPKGYRRLATANITPSPQTIAEKDVALTAGSTWSCWDESPRPTTQREPNLLPPENCPMTIAALQCLLLSFRLACFTFERQMYMHRLVRLLYPAP